MKHLDFAKYAALAAGAAALAMRAILYSTAVDATGRLVSGHPLSWVVVALTVLLAVLAFDAARSADAREGTGWVPALGHWVFALGIFAAVTNYLPPMTGSLATAWTFLGFASIPCLLAAGCFLVKKREVPFFTHAVPTLFLTVHLICHYQLWCSNPQLQDVFFPLFATIALMVIAYQQTAIDVQMGSERQLAFARYAAVYLCIAELAVDTCFPLYAAGALFAVSGLWKPREV